MDEHFYGSASADLLNSHNFLSLKPLFSAICQDWAVFLSWRRRLSSAIFLKFVFEITGADQVLHCEGRAFLNGGYRRQRVDGCTLGGQAGRPWGPTVVVRGAPVVVELAVEVLGVLVA